MSLYEGMFVMDNRQANRDWDGSLEKLKSMLAKHGAELVRAEKWGERKLAYEMQGRRRGTYMLLYFNATGTGRQPDLPRVRALRPDAARADHQDREDAARGA